MTTASKAKYETIIGLEVHVEMNTRSKIFCGCSAEFGVPPNTNVCPICLGHPGVLPVLNREVLNKAMKASLALNCTITQDSKFDRKNYFYPDSPDAYQISQFDKPIGQHGWVEIEVDGYTKRIGVNRVHMEEDAGKSTHAEDGSSTLVDFNRAGVPLIEIVSEPDIRTPNEAKAYLEKLKAIMQYCEISDCKMEEGSLRCDANISLRPWGREKFGTKRELKNMNSFTNVKKALEFEQQAQEALIDSGTEIQQATLRWDDAASKTVVMRSKEDAHDYRYFTEPDLVQLEIDDAWIASVRATIPELPAERKARYISEFSLPSHDVEVLTASKRVAEFFEASVATGADAKTVSNWIMGDVLGYLNSNNLEITDVPVKPEQLGAMIKMIEEGQISNKIAKDVFKDMLQTGKDPQAIVAEKGLVQISDEGELLKIIGEVIANNPKSVEDYKAGKERALGALVGQVMKATKGKGNPGLVNKLILESLNA
ncbi:Asp-tRNA(Asn)/Glu-tRNA(Gln) amidotransferase subunit GatB [Tumebacillus permanentifrigoris]|uniref:Aspartyl/glutamyl-tRNA(Asn/Gln) amidotransferase subunit B n=1 Tax=Tumebacillus permanentifrigoris TaxID=378543 RepID=A0A316DXG9_9BACL|nr:Asp-tRNA(Asn)/Glu-tRNA(Gln) amidotransferase subunit GatB [Tumebacillus permanentifrigoris]PWK14811.1 aspartyl/glutamyl-tRNA(Asn/Gln) amidotransferase subunit B [Tumebacillus permanentifrigoris]